LLFREPSYFTEVIVADIGAREISPANIGAVIKVCSMKVSTMEVGIIEHRALKRGS
jgi:hypothetical protein